MEVDMKASSRKLGGVSPEPARKPAVAPTAPVHGDFVWNNGPIITCPLVYASFWGSHWSDATHQAQASRLMQFLRDMLKSTWMNILTQYGCVGQDGGGFVQASYLSSGIPANVTDDDIHTILQGAIDAGSIPEPPINNTTQVIIIYLDESVAVKDPSLGITMCEPGGDNAFGYHFDFVTAKGNPCYYAVIPALDDTCIMNTCPGGCSLTLSETQEQRRTQVTSHEFAEMCTDPKFPTGWFGPFSDENGDICNGETTTITVGANTWNVQRIYSKTDDIATNGATFCLAAAAAPIPRLPGGPPPVATPSTISLGSTGDDVKRLQRVLARHLLWNPFGPITGVFDASLESSVKAFQAADGLTVDGVVGPETWSALPSYREASPELKNGSMGPAVAWLQRVLAGVDVAINFTPYGGPIDGRFGPQTETALCALQTWAGLTADGVVGDDTWFTWMTPGTAQQLTLEGACGLTGELL
jgi:peptidoglycan hydrolase-like protein with peptidoglycan-binding domain